MFKKKRTAIILCGGRGSRLGVLSKKIPKTLVRVQKKEILWFIINILKKNNFNHIILPVGYKGEKIKKFIKKNFKQDNNIEIFNTGLDSSIASRIFKIKKHIKSEDFLLLNGDAIFNFDLEKIYKNHKRKKIKMTFISFSFQADFGTISIKDKKIIGFQRNFVFNNVEAKNKDNLKAYVYSGISLMNKSLLVKNFKLYKNFEKELYPQIVKKFKCSVKIPKGFFTSIDNIKDIYKVNAKNLKDSKYLEVKKIKELIISSNNKNDR